MDAPKYAPDDAWQDIPALSAIHEEVDYVAGLACSRCRGTGAIESRSHIVTTFPDGRRLRGTVCPVCGGRGAAPSRVIVRRRVSPPMTLDEGMAALEALVASIDAHPELKALIRPKT